MTTLVNFFKDCWITFKFKFMSRLSHLCPKILKEIFPPFKSEKNLFFVTSYSSFWSWFPVDPFQSWVCVPGFSCSMSSWFSNIMVTAPKKQVQKMSLSNFLQDSCASLLAFFHWRVFSAGKLGRWTGRYACSSYTSLPREISILTCLAAVGVIHGPFFFLILTRFSRSRSPG